MIFLNKIIFFLYNLFKKDHVTFFSGVITNKKVDLFLNSSSRFKDVPISIPDDIKNISQFYFLKHTSSNLRILIHLPSLEHSPGGYSIFLNIYETLSFMGINVNLLNWDDNFDIIFNQYQPNIFITSDEVNYLSRINWKLIKEYKEHKKLKVGLTASLEEYGNSPLNDRIKWAKDNLIDFYYSFRAKEYTDQRKEYDAFRENGFNICNIEFGANLLKFYPVNELDQKQFDYIFFGSTNYSKQKRYFDYFLPILKSSYNGMIWGPGWPWAKTEILLENQKLYYSKSKIALNLHLQEQIDWPCELNERTYILAACKVPQLLDNPALIKYRFSEDSYFSATNPKEYIHLMNYMIQNVEEVKWRTDKMYDEVINKHTTFHRMENFISFLNKLSDK